MPGITEDSLREFLDWHAKVTRLCLLDGMSDYTKMKVAFEAGWQARSAAEPRPPAGREMLETPARPEKTVFTRHTVSAPFQGRQDAAFEQQNGGYDALTAESRARRVNPGLPADPVPPRDWPMRTPGPSFMPAPPANPGYEAATAMETRFDHIDTIWDENGPA